MTLSLFVLTTRGLEAVAAQELATLPGTTITGQAYRRVQATIQAASPALTELRTVDDVYLHLAQWEAVGHTRAMLVEFEDRAAALAPAANQAIEAINTLRPLRARPTFSVTASFVGKRNYNTDEIKSAIAAGIESHNPWHYTADDREADLNVRVFIEHEVALVGLRIGTRPLHERAWKVAERPGALKPSVAAALCRLVEVAPGQHLIDPCCGGGTLLIEAAISGARARGGDLDPEAVEVARANGTAAGFPIAVEAWDSRHLPLPDTSIDRVLSNLPWGKQITIDATLTRFYAETCREIERILKSGGIAALLTSQPELLHFERLKPTQTIEISLYGQTPTISLFTAP